MNRSKLLGLAISLLFVACGGAPAPSVPAAPTATTPAATTPAKAPGDEKVGGTAKCPVSREEFVVEATSPKADYDGKTYYFCCAGCKSKFEADPAKFAKKS